MIAEKKSRLTKKTGSGEPIFIERPVPSQQQVKIFERAVKKEAREEEIDDNLSEIYRDKSGELVDVSHLHYQKKFVFVSVIKKLFVLAVLFCLGYGFYSYFYLKSADTVSVDLAISAPTQVKAGEDFNYTIHYKNNSKFALNSLRLELKYPENFAIGQVAGAGLEAISTSTAQNYFSLPSLPVGSEVNLVVTGKLIAPKDSNSLFGASLSYEPGDFSSEFKKEAATSVAVNDLGFNLDFEYANAALVGEDSQVDLVFSEVKDNPLNDFEVSFSFPENISLIDTVSATGTIATSSENKLTVTKTSGLIWHVSGLASSTKTYRLPIHYKITKKVDDNQAIIIRLDKKLDNGKTYVFAEKTIQLNVMNSNLNLTLILNGSKNDGSANFGDTLSYSLVYANKSDAKLDNVVIMAALKSDFLDWSSLKDAHKGTVGENTITWTKEEIPDLTSLAPGEEGTIDFSVGVRPYSSSDLGKSFTVTSYAQFSTNNLQGALNDSKSNNIVTKINSDLNLAEKVLYFDENNIPVGSGPLPPKVNQKTSVRVYWKIENNLHELSDTKVVSKLPDYVNFEGSNEASTGALSFDSASHSVIWNIGTLPVSTYQAQGEFNISVTPSESQRNSILVLLAGSTVTATDSDTKSILEKKVNPKTTKLEDDEIANLNNSGLVE